MFCDLDGFKAVNDAYGHQLGDRLLVAVAQRIGGLLRPQDTFARLGGDEFVIVLAIDIPDDAVVVAERIIAAAGEPFRWMRPNCRSAPASASPCTRMTPATSAS
jgi:diguanylate cyclase (GGDEF)-like protein